MTKFKTQALHIIRIKYLKASGSGNSPSFITAFPKIAIYALKAKSYVRKTEFHVLFRTSLKRNDGHSLCSIYCHNSENLDHC